MTRAIKARSGAPDRSKRRIDPPTPTSARRSSTTALTRRQLNSDRLLDKEMAVKKIAVFNH
jgi:hypothetical protein